jgi:hypothetical protein
MRRTAIAKAYAAASLRGDGHVAPSGFMVNLVFPAHITVPGGADLLLEGTGRVLRLSNADALTCREQRAEDVSPAVGDGDIVHPQLGLAGRT